ncbi:DUF1648 domain-containing protein [Streptomyces sp. DT171]|uniref:DUF1648 domain-containing protein n=1 Tax=Streptomyces sp. DT171 TaxID=3416524 RepID=UPI003CEFFF8C
MNRKNLGGAILAALPFLLALAVDLALLVAFGDRLPDRLASHFGGTGQVDGHASHTSFVVTTTVPLVAMAALWPLMIAKGRFHGRSYLWMFAGGYAFAAFFGYLMGSTLLANLDAPEGAADVEFPMWHIAVAVGAAALGAGLGLLLIRLVAIPEPPPEPERGDAERITLRDGEVAGWTRSMGAWWLPLVALTLVAVAVVVLFVSGWAAALAPLVIGLLTLNFVRLHVSADRRGLTVSGLLPWPRARVSLDRIDGAVSRDINALAEYGGWGYRVRPGRSGVMIRSGEGVVVRLESGRDFAVTVDDSTTAAALLNTLVDRRRAGH